jgi:putative transposase
MACVGGRGPRKMFKGRQFAQSVILLCVRWYLAYNLSLRNLEEMMAERGIAVDHATVHRWVVRYSSELLERFNRRKRAVTGKWHVDETYIKVRGRWMCVDAPLNARKIITYDLGTVIGC